MLDKIYDNAREFGLGETPADGIVVRLLTINYRLLAVYWPLTNR